MYVGLRPSSWPRARSRLYGRGAHCQGAAHIQHDSRRLAQCLSGYRRQTVWEHPGLPCWAIDLSTRDGGLKTVLASATAHPKEKMMEYHLKYGIFRFISLVLHLILGASI